MKKGASTAIIMILIMLITVSLILMSYQWLLKYSPQTQQELEKNLLQKEGCLKIENIDTLNKRITIRNCGKNELSNFIIYIDDKPVGSYSNKLGPGGIIQISYTGYITPGVNHNIKISSDYADSPIITFIKSCDVYITQSMVMNTYTIDQSDTYYCLSENIHIDGQNAIYFPNVQGSTLDCRGYNIDGNDTSATNGVLIQAGSTNNVITDCNITDFYHNIYLHFGSANTVSYNKISNSDNDGIRVESTDNNIITNNIITMPKADSQGGIVLSYSNSDIVTGNIITATADNTDAMGIQDSNNNIISGNTISANGQTSDGIWLVSSNSNTIFNNIIANKDPAHGVHIDSSNNNNITGGSVISQNGYDYYLQNTGSNNKFASTNFTAARTIYFYDPSSWFNYNNETTGNIWLKTRISSATNLTRRLSDWSQTLMRWNDSTTQSVTATYNITGLTPNSNYNASNNSIPIAGSPFNSGSNGQINFTINLSAGKEQEIKIVRTSYTISPLWFTNSTNNTVAGKPTLFSLYWTDDIGLGGYIFSTNNSGTWVNDTWRDFENQSGNAKFIDGFESGNLSAWDGNTTYGVGKVAVQNSVFYNGGYASNFTSISTDAAIAYKAITAGTDYYISSYIRLSAMPTGSSPVVVGAGFAHSNSDATSWALIAKPIVQLQGGNLYWGVRSIYGGGTSSQNYLESTPSKPTANTWYQVEMHLREGTSGQFQLWVNGVLKVNQTNVDNSARGNIGTACILLDSSYGAEPAMNLYVDDVVASASYINPENMGWSNVTKTLNSTVGSNVQWCVYANDTSNNWNMTSCVNPFSLTTSGGADSVLNIHFNEANGTKAYDSSVYGNDGIFYGETFNDGTLGNGTAGTQPTRKSGAECKYGSCLGFEGTPEINADVVNITDIPNSSLTIMAWIYPKQILGDERAIVSKWKYPNSVNNEWFLRLGNSSTAKIEFYIRNLTGDQIYTGTSNYVISPNVWFHVAVAYNIETGQVSFYKNGTLEPGGGYVGTIWNTAEIVRVGAQGGGSFDPFNGTIDEVRIFNRVLSQSEIQAEMNSPYPVIRPLASWSFEETGQYANDTHIWIKGNKSSALSFDGSNDYFEIPDSSSLDINENISITAWVYPNGWGGSGMGRIVDKGPSYEFYIWDVQSAIKIWFNNGAVDVTANLNSLQLNKWQHVAFTYNRQNVRFYVDGLLVGSPGATSVLGLNDNSLFIGNNRYGSRQFNGTIDEVRIWNRTLTQAEIQADMNVP